MCLIEHNNKHWLNTPNDLHTLFLIIPKMLQLGVDRSISQIMPHWMRLVNCSGVLLTCSDVKKSVPFPQDSTATKPTLQREVKERKKEEENGEKKLSRSNVGIQSVETNVTVNMKRKVMEDECAGDFFFHLFTFHLKFSARSGKQSSNYPSQHHLPRCLQAQLESSQPNSKYQFRCLLVRHNVIKTKRWHHSLIYYLHWKVITQENESKPPYSTYHIMPHIATLLKICL